MVERTSHYDDDRRMEPPPIQKAQAFTSLAINVMTLLGMLAAGLVWGMKLEARYDLFETRLSNLSAEHAAIKAIVDAGVLPITRERLNQIENEVQRVDREQNATERDFRDWQKTFSERWQREFDRQQADRRQQR